MRYATLASFPVRSLVVGADTARRQDVAMMVWLLRAPGRTVLVDAGFYREKFVRQWRPAHVRVAVRDRAHARGHGGDRVGRRVPLREPRARLVVPRHDPAAFVRFPRPGGGVARIEP